MLNAVLASFAVALWCLSYGLYFGRDLYRWWRLRPSRRMAEAAARQQAVQAYADWVRNLPPARSRTPVMPQPVVVPVLPAAPARGAVIVPFPRSSGRLTAR